MMKKLLSCLLATLLLLSLCAPAAFAEESELPKYGIGLARTPASIENFVHAVFTPEEAAAGETVRFELKALPGFYPGEISIEAVGGGSVDFVITQIDYFNGSVWGEFVMPDLGAVVDLETLPLASVQPVVTVEQYGEGTVTLKNEHSDTAPPTLSVAWSFTLTPAEGRDVWFEAVNKNSGALLTPEAVGGGKYVMQTDENRHCEVLLRVAFCDHEEPEYENGICRGCGTVLQPATENGTGENGAPLFEISNAGQLLWFAEYVNAGTALTGGLTSNQANAVLTADIDLNPGYVFAMDDGGLFKPTKDGKDVTNGWRMWEPIGTGSAPFKGCLDGAGHRVSGMFFADPSAALGGMLGKTDGAAVKGLGVVNSCFLAERVGGVIAEATDTVVEGCYGIAILRGFEVGGLLGEISDGSVKYCYFVDLYGGGYDMIRVSGESEVSDCFYLADSELDALEGTAAKTALQFASGEVAYLLNCSKIAGDDVAPAYWGQTLAGEDKDPYPVARTLQNTVYYGYISCAESTTMVYTNDSRAIDIKPAHNVTPATCTEDGVCNECGATVGEAKGHKLADATCTEPKSCIACDHTEGNALGHTYDNDCDLTCNVCGATRTVEHVDADKDGKCDVCGAEVERGLTGLAIACIVVASVSAAGVVGICVYRYVLKKKGR